MCAGMQNLATKGYKKKIVKAKQFNLFLRDVLQDLNRQHYIFNAIEEINCSCVYYKLCSGNI